MESGLFLFELLSGHEPNEVHGESGAANSLTIGHGVWIGHNATLLPPSPEIGHGAVIAPGSVVSADVPP
jgi:acetyltransferase-like isoleucine patch superfamily enzyme